jgi:hypothetical protein
MKIYGTALGPDQLNASATFIVAPSTTQQPVTGTFAYYSEPGDVLITSGTVLSAGTQQLKAVFTPTGATASDYTSPSITSPLVVTQAVPVLAWGPLSPIPGGTALPAAQFNASATFTVAPATTPGNVAGTFAYYLMPAHTLITSSTVLSPGTLQLQAEFTPTGATASDYTIATLNNPNTSLIVVGATITGPSIPSPLYGGPASRIPIYGGTASSQGIATITLTPASLPAGVSVPVALNKTSGVGSATFPDGTTTQNISQTTIVQINGTANSTVPNNMQITCCGAASTFTVRTWPINFAQTSGTSTDDGVLHFTYSWSSESGNNADLQGIKIGEHVAFNLPYPAPPYIPPSGPPLNGVWPTTPVVFNLVNWDATTVPMPDQQKIIGEGFEMPFGPTTLIGTQNYQFEDPVFDNPPVRTYYGPLLGPLTITRTTAQPDNVWVYTITKSGVTKSINMQEVPLVTYAPPPIIYGTPLNLNASAKNAAGQNVPGTFTYPLTQQQALSQGQILGAGTYQFSVVFAPTDAVDYTTVTQPVTLVVNKQTPVISWGPLAAIASGTALGPNQLNASATGTVNGVSVNVNGQFNYDPGAGTVFYGPSTQTLSATFNPQDPDFQPPPAATRVILTVDQ